MNEVEEVLACSGCGTQLAPGLLACPRCQHLVHAGELKVLAAEAESAAGQQAWSTALAAWRRALELIPPEARQHQAVLARIAVLTEKADSTGILGPARSASGTEKTRGWGGALTGLGALGLLLWKFKFLAAFLATKGKLLLLGLTKGSTFLSMFLSLGVYWTAFGWKFALGVVLSIYVHEMGHVAALRRFGIAATAPMFLPGLGAIVRLKQHPASAREDARVGLAGPLWGLGAALGAYCVYLATGWRSWAAIAHVGAWINLFNLLPVWQLDGSRGFRALSRSQRWLIVAAIAGMWFVTAEGLLVLLLIVAVLRALSDRSDAAGDRTALVQFLLLVIVLSAMTLIRAE